MKINSHQVLSKFYAASLFVALLFEYQEVCNPYLSVRIFEEYTGYINLLCPTCEFDNRTKINLPYGTIKKNPSDEQVLGKEALTLLNTGYSLTPSSSASEDEGECKTIDFDPALTRFLVAMKLVIGERDGLDSERLNIKFGSLESVFCNSLLNGGAEEYDLEST